MEYKTEEREYLLINSHHINAVERLLTECLEQKLGWVIKLEEKNSLSLLGLNI